MRNKSQLLTLQQRQLELKKTELELKKGLPHLYAFKFYKWSRDFFESTNEINLLCAANQISKSSTQIRKCIDWATNKAKWPGLWSTEPNQFWYLYPSSDVATVEFEKKWMQFLPKDVAKEHPIYGWHIEKERSKIKALHFNSGVSVYFKTYAQNPQTLQSGSCYAIFCFTQGHLVETDYGLCPVEQVSKGTRVLTRQGHYEEVQDCYSRETSVITRYLSNGLKLEGTPDHRVWTKNRGYVALVDLTSEDVLDVSQSWQRKRQKYFRAKSIIDTHSQVTTGTGTMPLAIGVREATYIKQFGSFIGALFPTGIWCTTRMKISQTIDFLIWSLSQGLSTQAGIKERSGLRGFWVSKWRRFVSIALKSLLHARHKEPLEGIVLRSAEKLFTLKLGHVVTALKSLWLARTPRDSFVLDNVVFYTRKKKVYNINVKNVHNYYLSGINLANCDEELPIEYLDELMMRISAVGGYFHMVFTATLNQDFWRRAIEPSNRDTEVYKDAWKRQVSMYECLEYEDGSPTPWTVEKIKKIEARCKSEQERLRRVEGRFVTEEGRIFGAFDASRHFIKAKPIPGDWHFVAGVDIGSGGTGGHPSSIAWLAVRPDYRLGYVVQAWRGDGVQTTSGDVLNKFIDMRGKKKPMIQTYDPAARDFGTIAARMGESFIKAEKSHELGEDIVNTLFKNDMLFLFDTDEIRKLGSELSTLMKATPKNKRKDDLADATRYATVLVPWDFGAINAETDSVLLAQKQNRPLTREDMLAMEVAARRGEMYDDGREPDDWSEITEEIESWNEQYG